MRAQIAEWLDTLTPDEQRTKAIDALFLLSAAGQARGVLPQTITGPIAVAVGRPEGNHKLGS